MTTAWPAGFPDHRGSRRRIRGVRGASLLRELDESAFHDLVSAARPGSYGRGRSLVREGLEDDRLYLVVSGTAKRHQWTGRSDDAITDLVTTGDLVNAASVVTGAPPAQSTTALTPIEVLGWEGRFVRGLMVGSTAVAGAMARHLAERLRLARRAQLLATTADSTTLVLRRLVELVDGWGEPVNGQVHVDLPLTQDELSAWAGVSRETTTKVLRRLRQTGVVRTSRRHIAVLDQATLRRMARGDGGARSDGFGGG